MGNLSMHVQSGQAVDAVRLEIMLKVVKPSKQTAKKQKKQRGVPWRGTGFRPGAVGRAD